MPAFSAKSKAALTKCHPHLQDIADEAIREVDFMVLDATRGRIDQERALATGKSKAPFGQSAHNYVPAIAFDLFPGPYDWNDRAAFKALALIVMRIAKSKNIPIRWGGDWNMDCDKCIERDRRMPPP